MRDSGRAPDAPVDRPKILRRSLPSDPPATVPARMVNEVLYCERLMYLEWAQGEFADNYYTVDGRSVHRRADKPGKGPPPPPESAQEDDDVEPAGEPPPWTARSVWLTSEKLGLTGKIDVVEGDGAGNVVPVEYKRGSSPDVPDGAWLPERAQLCAQGLLLREHGYDCDEGWIWFAKDRRRVRVVFHEGLVGQTLGAVARARELVAKGTLPAPLDNSPKCGGCSLSGICLPDEVELLQRIEAKIPAGFEGVREHDDLVDPLEEDPWGLAADALVDEPAAARRLQPARDDRMPLYLQAQSGRLGLKGQLLTVWMKDRKYVEARLTNTSQVCVFGNIQISTQAMRELLSRGIPLSFFTTGGWFLGRASGLESKNVELRVAQHRAAADPRLCLRLARAVVASKILNCRTLLRRNHAEPDEVTLGELRRLARSAREAVSLASLLGIEGTAARLYFSAFSGMLKSATQAFDWQGRNRRPPKDPVNAMLSLAYSLLAKDYTITMYAVGLDPLLGFFHQPRFGRPALALDLMEELRPIVADSTVISAVNNGVIGPDDFDVSHVGCAFKPKARRRFIQAYERRMDQLVAHPLFGYRISYRRLLEVQARLLGRLFLGEIRDYPEFRTR